MELILHALYAHRSGFISDDELDAVYRSMEGGDEKATWDRISQKIDPRVLTAISTLVAESMEQHHRDAGETLRLWGDISPLVSHDNQDDPASAETIAAIDDPASAETIAAIDDPASAETIAAVDDPASAETIAAVDDPSTGTGRAPEAADVEKKGGNTLAGSPASPLSPAAGTRNITLEQKGRYVIVGELGKGGIGRVLLGKDMHTGREIAIKELLVSQESTGSSSQTPATSSASNVRFLREAHITANLEHPSIIPVYEIGERQQTGALYYTMKRIRGETLGRSIKNANGLAERLRLLPHFASLCQAIAFAHSKGIIHRDIKPGNIMLGEFGETVVLDWGLARGKYETGSDSRFKREQSALKELLNDNKTREGATLGTPAYMPPEQARGAIAEIDERADIYSLGAVLYQLLTGRPPYTGANVYEVLMKVIEGKVTPPSQLVPGLPGELNAITMKALAASPDDRYQSATELALEIESYMAGDKVTAHEYSSWELFRRFVAKNRALVLSSLVVSGILVISLILISLSFTQEKRAKEGLARSVTKEQAARKKAVEANKRMLVAITQQQIAQKKTNYRLSQALMEKADQSEARKNRTAAAIYAATALYYNPTCPKSPWYGDKEQVRFPGGKTQSAFARGKVLWSLLSPPPRLTGTFALPAKINRVAVTGNGKSIIAGLQDGNIILYREGKKVRTLKTPLQSIWGIALSPDEGLAAISGHGTDLMVYETATLKQRHRFSIMEDRYYSLAFTPKGDQLLLAGTYGAVERYDLTGKNEVSPLGKKQGEVYAMALSPNGESVALGGLSTIWLKKLSDGSLLRAFHDPTAGKVTSLHFSSDGRYLVSATLGGRLRVFDGTTLAPLSVVSGDGKPVNVARWIRGTHTFAMGGEGHAISIYSWSGELLRAIPAHRDIIQDLAVTKDGASLLSGAYDKSLRVFSLKTSSRIRTLRGHGASVSRIAFDPKGKHLYTAGEDRRLNVWNRHTGKLLHSRKGTLPHMADPGDGKLYSVDLGGLSLWDPVTNSATAISQNLFFSCALSKSAHLVAAGAYTGEIVLHDTRTQKHVATLKGHTRQVSGLAFSPDGKRLYSISRDRTLRIFDLGSKKEIRRIEHRDWLSGVAVSPDGSMIATSGKHPVINVWDAQSGKLLFTLQGHSRWVNRVAFSPEGKRLLSSSSGGEVRLWDLSTRSPLIAFRTKQSVGVAFSPEGTHIAISDYSNVHLIPLALALLDKAPRTLASRFEKAGGVHLEGIRILTK